MKLFHNLSTDLAEKVVENFFLFIAWRPYFSTERNGLSNFGRRLAKEHFSEIISKSVHRFSRKSYLKLFSSGHFVQQSGTVWANLVDIHLRNIPV